MNKIHRIVFNRILGVYQVVSENAKAYANTGVTVSKASSILVSENKSVSARHNRKSALYFILFSASMSGFYADAACTIIPGGGISTTAPTDNCVVPDGTYSENIVINASLGGLVSNTGSLVLNTTTGTATPHGVWAYRGATIDLNDLSVNNPLGGYGLHTGENISNTGGLITVHGNYVFTGAGTAYGAAAGNLGSLGVINLNNVQIDITAGTGGAGLITSTNANNKITTNGTVVINSAANTGYGIQVGNNSMVELLGASNIIRMTGTGTTGIYVGSASKLNVTGDLSITSLANGLIWGGDNALININNINISSGNGTGLGGSFGSNSKITALGNVQITHSNGYGVFVSSGSEIDLRGSSNTITTTGASGYGVYVMSNAQFTATDDLNITTSGKAAVTATGSNAVVNLQNMTSVATGTDATSYVLSSLSGGTITTNGNIDLKAVSPVIFAQYNNASVVMNGAQNFIRDGGIIARDTGSITVNGNMDMIGLGMVTESQGVITLNADRVNITTSQYGARGIYAYNASATSSNTATINIYTSGQLATGIHVEGSSGQVHMEGTTNIETINTDAYGVSAYSSGVGVLSTLNIITRGAYGYGVITSSNGSLTLQGSSNQIETLGDNGSGLVVSSGRINLTGLETFVQTRGNNAYGAFIQSSAGTIDINGRLDIATTGTNAHGFVTTGGATKTLDGAVNNLMPTITVQGSGSALFNATGANSRLTLAGNSALNMSATAGVNTWGAKADTSGTVVFAGTSNTGGTGLWADNGTLQFTETSNAAGSHVKLDNTSTFNFSTHTGTLNIGSLEGSAASTVNLGSNTLSIGSNNTDNNGSIMATATYAGRLVNTGSSLSKIGTTTQVLSGTGSTVAAVTVDAGTLRFTQANAAFTTTGNYTTASNATTDLGINNSKLVVGGIFTQAADAVLHVTVGAAPNVTADTAVLNGTLVLGGLSAAVRPATASAAESSPVYTLIQTTNGITGDFTTTSPLLPQSLDYLSHDGYISNDGKDYNLGFRLAWTQGRTAQSTGSFTIDNAQVFNVDLALADQTLPVEGFDTGWDGKSLTKAGGGTLVLSRQNLYTGTTTLNAGMLRTDIADSIAASSDVILNGGQLNLNGNNQQVNRLAGTGGQILLNGANLTINNLIDGADDTTFQGAIIDDTTQGGSLTKVGAGALTLTGENTYTGQTTLTAGTLNIGQGDTSGSLISDIDNASILNFNRSDDSRYVGQLTGEGNLNKLGGGSLILTGVNSHQGNVDVLEGSLDFEQDGLFSVTGDYTTRTGATTKVGLINGILDIGGTFTQEAGSTLNFTLGASPDIRAHKAVLDGDFFFNGFTAGDTPVKASDALSSEQYVVIHTTDGITGNFRNLADTAGKFTPTGVEYLLLDGHISDNGNDYELGFRLAWDEGDADFSTGNFTLNSGTAFDIDITLADQTVPVGGFATGWNGRDLVKAGDGQLILSENNTYSGTTTIKAGELVLVGAGAIESSQAVSLSDSGATLDVSRIAATSTTLNNLSGVAGSQIILQGKTLQVNQNNNAVYAGDFDVSTGQLHKTGMGELTLSGQTRYTGDTILDEGQLTLDGSAGGAVLNSNIIAQSGTALNLTNGAVLTGFIDPTDVSIDALSRWNMNANSIVNHLNHSGMIDMSAPNANTFKTLSIEGNYIGNNGLLVMNTQLGDDTSATDHVVILGNTAGTTRVQINNAGGTGAKTLEGIELIEVQGLSAGEFKQTGRIVAGAYDYTLARGQGNQASNWYLTSHLSTPVPPIILPIVPAPKAESVLRPEGASYVANLVAANTAFRMNLADRTGARQTRTGNNEDAHSQAFWLRSVGGQSRFNDQSGQINSKSTHYMLQFGSDLAHWNTDQTGQIILGAMAGYAHNQSQERSQITHYRAKGSVSGYSVGVYGTWYANALDQTGAYIDSWAQYNWFNNRVKGDQIQQERYRAQGLSASLEAGYRFKVASGDRLNYFIQPHAQATWMGVNAGDHRENNGTRITNQKGNQLETRVGLKMSAQTQKELATNTALNMFIETNWIHHSKDLGIYMDDVSVKQGGARNVGEIKLGIESKLNQQLSIWGNLSHQRGSKGFKDTSVNIGLSYKF